MMKNWTTLPGFLIFSLIAAVILVRMVPAPNFTDAYYHFNAAQRLVQGSGLTDAYLWNYIGATGTLPQPSHLYWMPLTSLSAAVGMWLLNDPTSAQAAQLLWIPMLIGIGLCGYRLGQTLGGSNRHAWFSGTLTLFSGFYVPFWGHIDTFTPYALVGAACLAIMGLALEKQKAWMWGTAGALAALGHLTRADGLLLVMIGLLFSFSPWPRRPIGQRLRDSLWLLAAYLLVMSPWLLRNLTLIGTPLPLGGTQAIWFRTYDDLFQYPPQASPVTLFADGLDTLIESRWLALTQNLTTFIVVEGLVILTPLMLIGLWVRRKKLFLWPFMLYALGLHAAMTLAFPFPGYRGGLFHSAAALIPFWMALAAVGIDQAVDWIAKRRRRWQPRTAKRFFMVAFALLALGVALFALQRRDTGDTQRERYAALDALMTPDARVLANDPAAIYYYTQRGGAVLPSAPPEQILVIARQFAIDYLLIEIETLADGSLAASVPAPLSGLINNPPPFLRPLAFDDPTVRLYVIER